jgi:hypothetical protein
MAYGPQRVCQCYVRTQIYTIKLKNWLNKIICGIDRGNSRARVRARARARCIQFIPIFVPS